MTKNSQGRGGMGNEKWEMENEKLKD